MRPGKWRYFPLIVTILMTQHCTTSATESGQDVGDANQSARGGDDPNATDTAVGGAGSAAGGSTSPNATPSLVCRGALVWADDFSGTALDGNKWNIEVNCDGGGNGELECYTARSSNIYLDGNGLLFIHLAKENYMGKTYTSGRLNSSQKGDWDFGCFEARLQVPTGVGLWPGFWMLSTHTPYGTWPTSGELDIMEILGQQPNTLYGTAHFGPAWPHQQQAGGQFALMQNDFSSDFHVFSLNKTPTAVTWYVDGQAYYTLDSNAAVNWGRSTWPFDANNPFHFILNLAVGGAWPRPPTSTLQEADLKFDYVHAFSP